MNFITIETTCPSLASAKKLAKILLNEKLVACIQFQSISSIYYWQGKVENSKEILVNIKTKSDFFKKISKIIKKNHSYETPQIIAKKIDFLSEDYAKWLSSSLK
jgi:periplasmic divalent cation tolerance protein